MFIFQVLLAAVLVYVTLMSTFTASLNDETDKSVLSVIGLGFSSVYAIYLLFRMPDVLNISTGMAISTYLIIYLTLASIAVFRQGQKLANA